MKPFLIIGVDISKSRLDIFFKPFGLAMTIVNDFKGFRQWLNELKKLLTEEMNMLVVMEHTGQYSLKFESFLEKEAIGYCKLPAMQIKRSLGIVRGKSDKVDAERIAEYGWLRKEILVADKYPHQEITELRKLFSLRAKLVKDRSGYKARLSEMEFAGSCKAGDLASTIQKQMIATLSSHIDKVEKAIKSLIASNESLKATNALLISIKGIGWTISAYMISCTQNFTKFKNARKFNCYAGVAPFRKQSGTTLKGKGKISHLANKEAKTLLDRAACTALQHDKEIREYYQRRLAEGKSKRNCINNIRAKMVYRIFAVVKRRTPFVETLQAA